MYKVFLVDDEPLILDGMKLVINWEELGLEVVGSALTGAAALEFVDNNPVDILITDIRMPFMNGLELINAVKSKHSDIKVIILSGYDDFGYVKEAAKRGIENYLLKPVNDEELLSTLLLITRKLDNDALTLQKQRQDSTIIRDNILLRWVTDSINASELENRGDLLSLSIKGAFYTACIVHSPRRAEIDGRQYSERFQDLIVTICGHYVNKGAAYVFKNLEGDVVLLFHFDGQKPMHEELLNDSQSIIDEIAEKLGVRVFILVGSTQKGYENVHRSYTDAIKLMDYSLILSGSHVVDFNRTQQEMNRQNTEMFVDFKELKSIILKKDGYEIYKFIDNVYSRLSVYEQLTPAMLRNTTMQIGLFILNMVSMTKSMGKGFLDGTDTVFSDIWDRKSLQELQAWVKGVADTVVAFLLSADKVYSPVVKKVVQYIETNYDKEISLKCIANLLDMNAVYLGQIFKNETGLMFTVYLNNKRVEEAKKLLLMTKLNVTDIGTKVGYSNNNHFFSVFKKLVSVSPTEYRRANMSFQ